MNEKVKRMLVEAHSKKMPAAKQTAEPKADLELEREIITPDSILKRFKYYNDFVSEIRKKNKEDTGSMPLSPNK